MVQTGPSVAPGQGCWAGALPVGLGLWQASQHEHPC